jgi:hypothetical protein
VVSRKAKRRKLDTKLTCEGVISIPPESSVVAPTHVEISFLPMECMVSTTQRRTSRLYMKLSFIFYF